MQINTPGTYTLSSSIGSSNTSVITINADDVILDLNGRTVSSLAADKGTAVTFGVLCANRSNITIKNGTITGAFFGIHAGYGSKITLENLDLSGCTYIGANLGGSNNSIIRNCKFANITGYKAEAYAIGLNGTGSNTIVENCTFTNIYKQAGVNKVGEGVGVLVEAGTSNTIIRNCVFSNDRVEVNSIGIWVGLGSNATVTSNTFNNFHKGVASGTVTASSNQLTITPTAGSVAFSCTGGVASNNGISGYAKIVDGGITDGGGNTGAAEPPPPPPEPSPTPAPAPFLDGKVIQLTIEGVTYRATLRKI